MEILALSLATVAALIHVFIFYLESIAWTTPRARKVFGNSEASAETTKELAFNQGFYNLFLALAVFAGLGFYAAGQPIIAATLIFTGTGMMLSAALVLAITSPDKRGPALTQGLSPLLAVVILALSFAG